MGQDPADRPTAMLDQGLTTEQMLLQRVAGLELSCTWLENDLAEVRRDYYPNGRPDDGRL